MEKSIIFVIFSLISISLLIAFRASFSIVTVLHDSMLPTISSGERVLVLKIFPKNLVKKGTIVVIWPWDHLYRSSGRESTYTPFIKRITGLPGEKMVTTINELSEAHRNRVKNFHDKEGNRTWFIPPEHFFVRGDNPLGGYDSLIWGPVPYKAIKGVVLTKLVSISNPIPVSKTHSPEVMNRDFKPGNTAPKFEVHTLSGEKVLSDSFLGKQVLLIFFIPKDFMREKIYYVDNIIGKMNQKRVELVFISIAGVEETKKCLYERNLLSQLLIAPHLPPNPSNKIVNDFNIYCLPYYCYISTTWEIISAGNIGINNPKWKQVIRELT